MMQADKTYWLASSRSDGRPTVAEAQEMAGWTCAMGTAACDMAYCAYSFCNRAYFLSILHATSVSLFQTCCSSLRVVRRGKLANGTLGIYDECEGWDPVKGMPR